MRITTNMMMNSYLYNLNGNLNRLSKYVEQETTGKAINDISDDPVGVTKSLLARNRLSGTERYQDNVKTAKNWLTEVDSSVSELNKVIQAAYEDSVSASTGTLSDDDRSAMAEEVAQLRDEVLSTGNATVGDSYLFAGYSTTGTPGGKTPFKVDANGDLYYNGINMSNEASADDISAVLKSAAGALGNATDANTVAQSANLSDRGEILSAVDKTVGYTREVSSAASKAAAGAKDIAASADVQSTTMGELLKSASTAADTAAKAASDAAGTAYSAADAMRAAVDAENSAYQTWQGAIGTETEADALGAYSAAKSAADTAAATARNTSAEAAAKAGDAKTATESINSIVGAFGTFSKNGAAAAGADATAQAAYTGGNYGGVADAVKTASELAKTAADAGKAFADAPSVIGAAGAGEIADAVTALRAAATNAANAAAGVTNSTTASAAMSTIAAVRAKLGDLQDKVKNNVSGSDALLAASGKLDSESGDALTLQVGDGYAMSVSEPGTELLGRGSENLYVILDSFYQALTNPRTASDELGGYVDRLADAQSRALSLDAKVGAKEERLSTLSDRYEANVTNYTQMRSDAEDVDMAEAIMNYSSAKTVYDAALASGAQIIQTSLIDFLK